MLQDGVGEVGRSQIIPGLVDPKKNLGLYSKSHGKLREDYEQSRIKHVPPPFC